VAHESPVEVARETDVIEPPAVVEEIEARIATRNLLEALLESRLVQDFDR
jgi:hypothetical protein